MEETTGETARPLGQFSGGKQVNVLCHRRKCLTDQTHYADALQIVAAGTDVDRIQRRVRS